jgi:hypothetical protein
MPVARNDAAARGMLNVSSHPQDHQYLNERIHDAAFAPYVSKANCLDKLPVVATPC